tara:strand:- start:2674 stop:2850 length:177 start_codon:yes stop_codon:yes gene_type:complete
MTFKKIKRIIPDVNGDDFTYFLRWLHEDKFFTADQIINVVSEPYKYKEEYEEFNDPYQ